MDYEETQYGFFVIIVFVLIIIFMFLAYSGQWGTRPITKVPFLIMSGFFIFILVLFYKLNIKIKENQIKITYGIGLIRIRIRPEKVFDLETFRVPWYWGMGIRLTPKGWLYSLNSFKAVIIKYGIKGKIKKILIGTPDPEQLKSAIEHYFSSITEKDRF